jgi:hypothetical protein
MGLFVPSQKREKTKHLADTKINVPVAGRPDLSPDEILLNQLIEDRRRLKKAYNELKRDIDYEFLVHGINNEKMYKLLEIANLISIINSNIRIIKERNVNFKETVGKKSTDLTEAVKREVNFNNIIKKK